MSLALCLCAAFALVLLRGWSPSDIPFFPSCPFHQLTGLYCPGCGALRTVHSLLNGHLAQALAFNPMVVLFSPWFSVWGSNHVLCVLSGFKLTPRRTPSSLGWVLLVCILLFMILRNLPCQACGFLRPHVL